MHMLSILLTSTGFDLNSIPFSALSGFIAFISANAIMRYQIKAIKEELKQLKADRKADNNGIEDKFNNVEMKLEKADNRRDELKDAVHGVDKKVTEIFAIVTKSLR